MKILVTCKHIGIKKLLLPALARVKDHSFDVILNDENGLIKEDNYSSLNLIQKGGMVEYTYPKGTLKESFSKLGIDLNSYDCFIMAGLASTIHVLREFKKKIIIYTVAPLYRAHLDEKALQSMQIDNSRIAIVHSTPTHYQTYKTGYEYKYLNNTFLLAHGLDMNGWGKWNGSKKEILTVWGNADIRIVGKWLNFGGKVFKGIGMIKKLIGNIPVQIDKSMTEEEMRKAMRDFRMHLFFMKDQQTVGLVESLRIGIPIVGPSGNLVDPMLFMKYGHNGFLTDDGDMLSTAIERLMTDDEYAKKIAENERATCDNIFKFDCYVNNWKTLIEEQLSNVKLEQPECYKRFL